ncbi:MAG: GreA/GreB family elongation factor [Verrucomicrobia bacterium]|nr:GreA/GreB family elongation factor [Verrucomicrobiota bacterium]
MSKAFTRESDDLPEGPPLPRLSGSLPPGVRDYLTSDGARRLQAELKRLLEVERPKTARSATADVGQRRQLQALDHELQQLRQTLQSAEVVAAPPPPWEQVRFGATVTVKDCRGEEACYRIVGAAEADADRNWVSWLSPIAKALLNARLGHHVRLKLPSGEDQLEVLAISYEPAREGEIEGR